MYSLNIYNRLYLRVNIGEWEYYFAILFSVFVIFLWNAIGFGYVLYQFKLPSNIITCYYFLKHHRNTSNIISDLKSTNDNNNKRLINILSDETQFNLFARHLSREFQNEVLNINIFNIYTCIEINTSIIIQTKISRFYCLY